MLDRVRASGLPPATGSATTPEQQMAAMQVSTPLNLLMAGASLLLLYSSALGQTPGMSLPLAAPIPAEATPALAPPSAEGEIAAAEEIAPVAAAEPVTEKPISSAAIVMPTTFSVPGERIDLPIRTVILGGSGTRTSAVTIWGAHALPFRHFEGNTGHSPVVAMEIFDQVPKGYPDSLRAAYGDLLRVPAAWPAIVWSNWAPR